MTYASVSEYLADLEKRAALPEGFQTSTIDLQFIPGERPVPKPLPMRLNLLLLDEPTAAFAGVFTRNAFPGAPVLVGRKLLESSQTRGVLINNKVANVGGPTALADAVRLQQEACKLTGSGEGQIFPASTGIIGWSLPVNEMVQALPELAKNFQNKSALPLAKGIMTTDSYPKVRSKTLFGGRITAVAKGAGMIEPNLATMLVYIMTDIEVSRGTLRDLLPRVVDKTFNAISVDSDQSTSDMVLAFSSQAVTCPDSKVFEKALEEVCRELAQDIVRNGEGTAHVLEVQVTGAPDLDKAKATAKAVVNSPLVKTAVFGNDPNVGRFLSSVGDLWGNSGWNLDIQKLNLEIAGETVFTGGCFTLTPEKEEKLYNAYKAAAQPEKKDGYPRHELNVVIKLDLGLGKESFTAWGSDLSYEYVRENADYRS